MDSNGKVQSKCVASNAASGCPSVPNLASKVVPKTHTIASNAAAVISAIGSDNSAIATLDVPADTVSDVTFIVAPVADSVYQAGSFSTLFSSGKLRSPLVSISPNSVVDTRSGSITLSLAVSVPIDLCLNATQTMRVRVAAMIMFWPCTHELCRGSRYPKPILAIRARRPMRCHPASGLSEMRSVFVRL